MGKERKEVLFESNEKDLIFGLYIKGNCWEWTADIGNYPEDFWLEIVRMLSIAISQFVEQHMDRISGPLLRKQDGGIAS